MKKTVLFSLLTIIFLSVAQSAFALGLGLYGTGGVGWNRWLEDEANFAGTTYNAGGGLILDTCLAADRVFNYRLKVGAEFLGTPDIPYNWTRVHVVNTFGFGVVRTKNVRFWLGPEIIFGPFFGPNRWGVLAGMGLALGVNVNVGKTLTLAFTWSGRFEGGYREYTVRTNLKEDLFMYSITRFQSSLLPDTYRFTASGITVYGQFDVAVMFRIHDRYGK